MEIDSFKLRSKLSRFIGTTHYHPSTYGKLSITDGVEYLRESTSCCWLIDTIEGYNMFDRNVLFLPFQLWELKVNDDRSAELTCREDPNNEPVITEKIGHTDFPLNEITLYCIDKTVLLPTEY